MCGEFIFICVVILTCIVESNTYEDESSTYEA
jgi:hypothetical protein